MAQLILQNRFGFQPQYPAPLDQSNPLAKDFTVFVNFATPYYNAATGKALSIATVGTGVVQRATRKGLALYTPNDAWANIAVGEDWAGPNTIIAVCRINSIDNPWGGLFSKDTGSGTSTQFAVGRDNSTGSLYGSVADTTANSFGGASIPALVDFNVLVFTHSGVASTGMTYYRNGVLVGSTAGLDAQLSGAGVLGLGRSRDALTAYDSDVDWITFGRAKRVFSAAEIASLPTEVSLWGLQQAPARRLWAAPAGGGVPLASNSAPTATGAGTLSVKIPITGASAAGVTGQGTLSIALPLAGAGNAAVVGSATLSIAQAMQGSGQPSALGSGTLNLAIALNSAALATALGSGTLNGSVALGGNAEAGVAGSGTLKLSLALSSAAIANALGSGNLTVSGALGGASVASVTGSGSLSQVIPIQSASLAATNASGTLTQLVPITGSSSVLASGQGALHITVNLNAQALAQAIGVGNLTLRIALNGASIANAIATGALSGIVRPINPKYSIIGYARIRSITAASRVRSVVGM